MKKLMAIFVTALFMLSLVGAARAADLLKLVAKYKMPSDVKGRFDHLGVDPRGNRFFRLYLFPKASTI